MVLVCMCSGITSANDTPDITIDASNISGDRVAPIVPETDKTYLFDETAAKDMINQKSALLKINCNTTAIIQDLWLDKTNKKVFSVGITESDFDYSFDFRNCSLRGNRQNRTASNKTLTEAKALQYAKDFMTSTDLKKRIFSKFGAPVVIYKNGNYPVVYGGNSEGASMWDAIKDVEIDTADKWTSDGTYVSFSIVFPYLINGRKVYNQYGWMAGVSMEVYAEWVTSVNAWLLPFKWAIRNSEKVSQDELIHYIKRGGNNPYRGQNKEIQLETPQRIYVYANLWRNNTSELYLTSGIRFGSKIKPDVYAQTNYEMIIPDYKVFNNNMSY
jgi:hypothetical protein